MALAPRIEVRQSQSLTLTPQLMQSIRLLQLSHLELNAFIDTVNSAAPLWNALVGGPAGTPWDQRYLSPDPDTSYGTGLTDNRLDAWGASAIVSVDLGPVEFKSITAYRKIFSLFGVDQDGSPLDYASTRNRDHQRQFSEEAQLSGTGFDKRLTDAQIAELSNYLRVAYGGQAGDVNSEIVRQLRQK